MSARRATRHRGTKKVAKAAKGTKRAWFSGLKDDDPRLRVARIIAEPDPRRRRDMETTLAMNEAVRVATEEWKRQAERDYELARRHPGERIGAGELVDLLMRNNQRGK